MTPLHDIVPLNDTLPLRSRQTAMSYLASMAGYSHCSSPKDFCDDYGLSILKIMAGDREALTRLAVLCRIDLDELLRWSPVRVSERYFALNHELFSTVKSPRKVIRGCPVCMRNDIAVNPGLPADIAIYGRAENLAGCLQTCIEHQVALVEVRRPTVRADFFDPIRNAADLLEALEEQPVIHRKPTSFENHAFSRLLDRPIVVPRLAAFSLGLLEKVCRALGADILAADSDVSTPPPDDRLCVEAGFEALAGGEETLVSVLSGLRDRNWEKYDLSARAIPNLIKNLRFSLGNADGEALAEIIASAAFRVFPYEPGDTLLDVVCSDRHLHTLPSASRAYPMAPRVLEFFLENTPGLVVAGSLAEGKVLIDAAKADELFEGRVPFVAMNQVCQKVGLRWEAVQDFVDCGLLPTVDDHQIFDHPTVFSLPKVDAFLADFYDGWVPVTEPSPGRVPLSMAVNQLRTDRPHLLKFIAEKKLSVEFIEGTRPMSTIHLDIDEAFRLFYDASCPVSAADVAKMLVINENAAQRMIEAGRLTNLFEKGKKNGCRFSFRVEKDEVDEFLKRYASQGEFARRFGKNLGTRIKLADVGLEPAFELTFRTQHNYKATFYHRSDFDRLSEIAA